MLVTNASTIATYTTNGHSMSGRSTEVCKAFILPLDPWVGLAKET
jgi:hypothetical protein